jgi:hypothetical protein
MQGVSFTAELGTAEQMASSGALRFGQLFVTLSGDKKRVCWF